MPARPRPLASLDPRGVPLPHGTEVGTLVDRVVANGADERVVPQGAVGRVAKLEGDRVHVQIVGVGVLVYARDEIAPRRAGQVRYAVRREEAFRQLVPCVVLRTRVGSHAWGLAEAGSDVDERGVFALPFAWTTGLVDAPVDLVSDDGSTTFWEIGKAIRQALRADPNTLETLFVPGVTATDEIGAWLLAERDAFVSSEIHASFGRYALSQLRRLEQSARLGEYRRDVIAWLRDDPSLDLDAVASRLAASSPRTHASPADAVHQAKEYLKQLYRSLYDQGVILANDFASFRQLAVDGASGVALEVARELRPKNAYNLLRLIATATRWLLDGAPTFHAEGAFRDELLAIKHGEVPIVEVLRRAEMMSVALEEARTRSKLPTKPDLGRADRLLRRVRHEIARRALSGATGPLGVDAPEPPLAEREDA